MTFKFPSSLDETTLNLGGGFTMTPRPSRRSTPRTNHRELILGLIDDVLDIVADDDKEHDKLKQIKQ
jgi:hypothetical protein